MELNRSFQSIEELYNWLDQIPMFGKSGKSATNFTLDSIKQFCEKIGSPHLELPVIHVAGTNGKGTTCRMLASVYQSAGYKTGVNTSPHLLDVRERFRVNSRMIPETELLRFFRQFKKEIQQSSLTYFELCTAIAFWYFYEQKVDICIIETGLGGRLDATNIVNPLVSVITSIGLEHTDLLGNTLSEIALEKGGIIKQKKPVVFGKLPAEAVETLNEIASERLSPVFDSGSTEVTAFREKIKLKNSTDSFVIQAPGSTVADARNCSTALATVNCLKDRYPVSRRDFEKGIQVWNKRFEERATFRLLLPELNWYFDGAHNLEAIAMLFAQLKSIAPLKKWTFVLSLMDDKLNSTLAQQFENVGKIYLYKMKYDRAANISRMKQFFPKGIELSGQEEIKTSFAEKHKTELVIFGGSFYFYNIVRRWMGNIADEL